MLGGQGTVRQSLYPEDDRDMGETQGATSGAGELPRVREGLGKRVTGCAPSNPARSGEGGTGAGGKWRRRGQQAHDLQDGVSGKGRDKALTS